MAEIAPHHRTTLDKAVTPKTNFQKLAGLYRWAAIGLTAADSPAPTGLHMWRLTFNGKTISRCLDEESGTYVQLSGAERADSTTCHITIGQLRAAEYSSGDGQTAIRYWPELA